MGSVFCMYISVFLSKCQKKKKPCHIVLHECLYFNLFVACQNEDLEHVAGVVTRKREEKLNYERPPMYSICVWWGKGCSYWKGGSGTKEEEKDDKGSIAFIGSRIKNIHTLPCVLPGPLYDVIAVPSLFLLWIWLKAATIWTSSSPCHRSKISLISLRFKSHE